MLMAVFAVYVLEGLAVLSFAVLIALDIGGLMPKKKAYHEHARGRSSYMPNTLVMVPCKGIDLTLEQNLKSLKAQDYKKHKLIAIVDSENDPALKIIKRLGISHIISDSKCKNCSGKVKAISTALEKFNDYEAYAIVDSDVSVGRGWLASLLAPLSDKTVGLSTMYPYFMPEHGFWSKIKMMWGFVGDSLLERESTRFGWGGSLAFRKELVDKGAIKFFKDSKYSVSDDICLTKITKSRGMRIEYVRSPKPVVNCSESFSSFFEWANRQTALTLLGYRKNLYVGLVYYSMEAVVIVSGVLLSVFASPLFLFMFLHYIRNIAIGYKRAKKHYLEMPLIVLALPFLYDINLIIASRMHEITWRGNRYKLMQA